MQNPIEARLPAVFVHVADIQPAAEFYGRILGLPPESGTDFQNGIFVYRLNNGVDLILDASHAAEITTAAPFHLHATCMFATTDIDAAYRFMQENGVELVTEIFRDPAVSFFNFKDPDGNLQMVCASQSTNQP